MYLLLIHLNVVLLPSLDPYMHASARRGQTFNELAFLMMLFCMISFSTYGQSISVGDYERQTVVIGYMSLFVLLGHLLSNLLYIAFLNMV